MLKKAALAVAGLCLFVSSAFAQKSRFEVALGGSGLISSQTSGNGVTLSPTNSGGFVASLGKPIGSNVVIQFNYGRSYNTQRYTAGPLLYRIPGDVTEITGSITYKFRNGEKLRPFVLGGVGVLFFGPKDTLINDVSTPAGAVRQGEPTFLYGGGADYALIPHLAVRLQYRGFFYHPPNFKVGALTTSSRTHLAEPSISLVFSF